MKSEEAYPGAVLRTADRDADAMPELHRSTSVETQSDHSGLFSYSNSACRCGQDSHI